VQGATTVAIISSGETPGKGGRKLDEFLDKLGSFLPEKESVSGIVSGCSLGLYLSNKYFLAERVICEPIGFPLSTINKMPPTSRLSNKTLQYNKNPIYHID
jgi:hypothetical protein